MLWIRVGRHAADAVGVCYFAAVTSKRLIVVLLAHLIIG